jgi:hypothetical protein
MNGHLFTYWPSHGRVECACGWKRKVGSRAVAMRQHLGHVFKKGAEAILTLPKRTRVPFTFDGVTI